MKQFLRLTRVVLTASLLGAHTLLAGIVLDDAPQDPSTTAKPINVPKAKDAAPAEKSAPVSDQLRFVNNDTLHGTLVSYSKDAGLTWMSLESKTPIPFQVANITDVRLDSHKPPENAAAAEQMIELTNNDELPGKLLSLDDKDLVLDTWYAGKLTIPRTMLKGITPMKAGPGTLYEGPTGLDGWKVGQNGNRKSWTYRDGTFSASSYGTIGRDMKFPDLADIQFDLVSRGNSQMSICIYAEQADNVSNCYMFQVNSNFVYLQRYSRNGSNMMGDQPVQLRGTMMKHDKMHFDIKVNKTLKTITLYINGAMVKQWTDPGDFAGTGTCMLFSSQAGMFVKVSNIKIAAWDGKLDEPTGGPGSATKEDSVKMANQDRVSGKLKSINDGKAVFASSYADLTIPLDRVDAITMSGEGADQAKRAPGDVRVYFPGRGSITMTLESWDAKEVKGSSANFGNGIFSPDAFQRLQFNLDRQATDQDADLGGGDSDDSGN